MALKPVITDSNIPIYEDWLITQVDNYVKSQDGLERAARKLRVHVKTLKKILSNKEVSRPTIEKLKRRFNRSESAVVLMQTPEDLAAQQLESFIIESEGVIKAAARIGIRPSTIERLLFGNSISSPSLHKILRFFDNSSPQEKHNPTYDSMTERLSNAYALYKQLGTLEAVGEKIGVTRERVRQLLLKGSRLGLFEYKPYDYPFVTRQKILDDYRRFLNLNAVARANKLTSTYLHKLLTAHNITENDLKYSRTEGRKMQCTEQYNQIVDELGYHPTTTEMQKKNSWRSLNMKIARLWGSFDAFREELNIPKPPQGSPSFSEDTRKWREHRQHLAFIKRMQRLDQIRECLSESGPLPISAIAKECTLKKQILYQLIHLLRATGEVVVEGTGAYTKYRLINNRGD